MFNKRFANKLLDLYDRLNDLEVENSRLRQTINFKNREIAQLEKGKYKIINNKEVTKNINELKAELNYWKETANEWRDKYKDAESDLHYWEKYCLDLEKELNKTAEYWKDVAFEFERHNKYLKELNKSVDK